MHVMFVCWGNICRSPMAERVARKLAPELGVDVELTSGGISSEEVGNGIDRRAARLLREHGYDADGHSARRVVAEDADDVDLFVVAEDFHGDRLVQLGIPAWKVKLITDYDPESSPGAPLPDPWYGDMDDFVSTLDVLERAVPRLLSELRA